jgi:hypothetical protein
MAANDVIKFDLYTLFQNNYNRLNFYSKLL